MTAGQQKEIAAGPRVTAVVVRAGAFEAQIGSDKGIVIQSVGPQGGRQKVITLTANEAGQLLALVAHGREVLEEMARKA